MEINWMIIIWLLPVVAFSGWLYGRHGNTSLGTSYKDRLHPEYFKGLNYVLNEQPDKAIEVFVKMLEVDSETVETHLALGNLFRRRGEVDRAIRIHQNLIARPNLNKEQRALALLELGMDYMRSGLFDRAESLFIELVEIGLYSVAAFTELLDIYQQEKDWENAIKTARRLELSSGRSLKENIAHFYCEQANELQNHGHDRGARELLKKAINIDANCVRASLIEAGIFKEEGKFKQAIRVYKRVERQDAEYIPEAVTPLLECYRQLEKLDEFRDYLRTIVDTHGGITPMIMLVELIAEQDDEEEAIKYITTELKKRPTVRGVDRLIEYALIPAQGKAKDDLMTIKDLTGKLLEDRPIYQCNHCGFDAKALHWQCPSCKNWNTVKPIHGVEGE
ncbi:MAG: lipopolysaccharide assembly protein LapB [Gammaproteobacteria bacterium]|nr:MAG: lipopolysaccharide assembly protein LapB [Gammaproteobacteria bacterium]